MTRPSGQAVKFQHCLICLTAILAVGRMSAVRILNIPGCLQCKRPNGLQSQSALTADGKCKAHFSAVWEVRRPDHLRFQSHHWPHLGPSSDACRTALASFSLLNSFHTRQAKRGPGAGFPILISPSTHNCRVGRASCRSLRGYRLTAPYMRQDDCDELRVFDTGSHPHIAATFGARFDVDRTR